MKEHYVPFLNFRWLGISSESSIKLESIRTFLIKKTYMKVQKSFLNYANSLSKIFNQECPNTPTCPNTPQFYTTDVLFSINVSIPLLVNYRHTFIILQ